MVHCEAVFFDAGQTLLRVRTSVGQVYADVANRYGVTADPGTLQEAFVHLFRERHADFHEGSSEEAEKEWWRRIVWDTFAEAGSLECLGSRFERFYEDLFELFAEPDPWFVYEDVIPTLNALQAGGIRLAVVSNWDRRLRVLLERLGLTQHFAFVLTSAEAGVRKPHRGIFETAIKRLGTPAGRTVHVGDSYEEDYLGAIGAGLHGFLLTRDGEGSPSPAPTVRSLLELPQALGLT